MIELTICPSPGAKENGEQVSERRLHESKTWGKGSPSELAGGLRSLGVISARRPVLNTACSVAASLRTEGRGWGGEAGSALGSRGLSVTSRFLGRYDLLFMPPSFPFGGMENPCLTFVTPCLLAGDRSLADVIIHEISHSWFGNLVTNANWGEFWLNEGFTMYAQRRISTVLFGKPALRSPPSPRGPVPQFLSQ